ncbi:hypothetical protein OOK31_25630 [Streptomyces sp. NBC_00249]|uniref:hypothetical protein n=1 Tax=Streptomyces sp. NBC_00249 TaxID=2975690 RepID=UPI002259B578|nr:hypothetical protein [Streptomyces sp. NBC_00249]MCX5197239.1 hypothetical protein [Streptomyces sp. NBC_00249]
MEVREHMGEAFDHEDHPLLHQQVRDPQTGRVGELMAVVQETLGYTNGQKRHSLTAYIKGADSREFTAAATLLELA